MECRWGRTEKTAFLAFLALQTTACLAPKPPPFRALKPPPFRAAPQSPRDGTTFETEERSEELGSPPGGAAGSPTAAAVGVKGAGGTKHSFPWVPGLSPLCQKIASLHAFEMAVYMVILVNAIAMGMERFDGEKMITTPLLVEYAFLALYTTELMIKLLAVGIHAFACGEGSGFNIIDTSVVAFGVVGLVMDTRGSGILRIFRVILRCMRCAKTRAPFPPSCCSPPPPSTTAPFTAVFAQRQRLSLRPFHRACL